MNKKGFEFWQLALLVLAVLIAIFGLILIAKGGSQSSGMLEKLAEWIS